MSVKDVQKRTVHAQEADKSAHAGRKPEAAAGGDAAHVRDAAAHASTKGHESGYDGVGAARPSAPDAKLRAEAGVTDL